MTHEERARLMFDEIYGSGVRIEDLEQYMFRHLAEASNANASEDAKLLTFLIQQSNFGDDWLSDPAWDLCYAMAANESDDHDPEDYQYWMRKAIKEAMEEESR